MAIVVPEIIKMRLKEAKIAEVAIVDETFDGISNEVLQGAFEGFVDALDDSAVFEEAKAICGDLEEPLDFDLDYAKELWAAKERWGPKLKPHAELLYNTHVQRLATLNQLAANLGHLDLKVYKLGARHDIPTTVRLVFLDYHLEPDKDVHFAATMLQQIAEKGKSDPTGNADLLAERIAKKLANWVDCPFLVLISERTELAIVRDDFRRRTNYLGGTFACLAKSKASDQETLYFHLGCWGVGHPALALTRRFFEAIVHSIDKTAGEFKQCLLALDAQDYSFIQRLSLSADGEPLGEYMLELIGAALSHRLRSQTEIYDAKTLLDGQHFHVHPPSVTQPSSELRRLYQDAITEPNVRDLEPHPLHKFQTPAPPAPMPRLVLGDILARKANDLVYMVVNAGCDLQFSPVNPDRHADPNLPIYLLPGKLERLSHSTSDAAAKRTELFELDGKSYRILWDHKHVITIAWNAFQTWCETGEYRRVGRLGPLYALSMQQIWTSGLGRVGVMVTPPLTESADFRVYLQDADGKLEPFGERIRGQVILGSLRRENKDIEWFLLTKDGMEHLHFALKSVSSRFEAFAQAVPDGPYKDGKMGNLRKFGSDALKATQNWDPWFQLLEKEHELPRTDGAKFRPPANYELPIAFCWQKYPAASPIKGFGAAFIVVDILRPEALDANPTEPTSPPESQTDEQASTNVACPNGPTDAINADQPNQAPTKTPFTTLKKLWDKMASIGHIATGIARRVRF